MRDSQARESIEKIGVRVNSIEALVVPDIDAKHAKLEQLLADQQTIINLLLGFHGIEAHLVPMVPAIPAVPAHMALRKTRK